MSPGEQSLVKSKGERTPPLPIIDSELKQLMYSNSFVVHAKKMRVKAVMGTTCGYPESMGQSRGESRPQLPISSSIPNSTLTSLKLKNPCICI